MAITKLMIENENNIRDAIENGISGEAVESTLEDVINKSDELKSNPEQIKDTVEAIVDMKEESSQKKDESYTSSYVKNNSEKIKSALNDGISPNEIATTLSDEASKKGKTHLPFMVKLISRMKRKELKLRKKKENTKAYQKLLRKID